MTEYTWKSVSVPLFRQDEVSPALWAALVAEVEAQESRMIRELNTCLYPHAGARDAADERLAALSGRA